MTLFLLIDVAFKLVLTIFDEGREYDDQNCEIKTHSSFRPIDHFVSEMSIRQL
jgi:hypothetical protein